MSDHERDATLDLASERVPVLKRRVGWRTWEALPLVRDVVLFGRDPEAVDVVLDHPSVSKVHARVEVRAGPERPCWIEDLGSRNGTLVNRARLTASRELHPGDIVSLGALRYTFEREPFLDILPWLPPVLPSETTDGSPS